MSTSVSQTSYTLAVLDAVDPDYTSVWPLPGEFWHCAKVTRRDVNEFIQIHGLNPFNI